MAGVPEQVRHHDRQARDIDDDLGQWVSDECVALERELKANKNTKAAGNQLYSGSFLVSIAHIKEKYLHHYRDEERRSRRKLAELQDAEGLRHRVWRKITRRGTLPTLTAPDQAQPILDGWRAEVKAHGAHTPVSDPTRRPLEWAVDKYGGMVPGNELAGEDPGEKGLSG